MATVQVAEDTAKLAGWGLTATLCKDLEWAQEFAQDLDADRTPANVEQMEDQLKLVGETVDALRELNWGLTYDG